MSLFRSLVSGESAERVTSCVHDGSRHVATVAVWQDIGWVEFWGRLLLGYDHPERFEDYVSRDGVSWYRVGDGAPAPHAIRDRLRTIVRAREVGAIERAALPYQITTGPLG